MADNSLKAIRQEIAKLRMLIGTHIGNPNAHPTMTTPYDPKGFIDGDTWRFAHKNPKWIPSNSDISTLNGGFYMAVNSNSLLNAPQNSDGVCYIEVLMQTREENNTHALYKFYNVTKQKVIYGWKATKTNGKIIWDRSNKKRDLGGAFTNTGSYFTVINGLQSTLVYVHVDIDVNVAVNSAATISTGFPGSLRPSEAIHFGGNGVRDDNSWGSAGLIFQASGSISVMNEDSHPIKHVNGTLIYQLHTEGTTEKWGE